MLEIPCRPVCRCPPAMSNLAHAPCSLATGSLHPRHNVNQDDMINLTSPKKIPDLDMRYQEVLCTRHCSALRGCSDNLDAEDTLDRSKTPVETEVSTISAIPPGAVMTSRTWKICEIRSCGRRSNWRRENAFVTGITLTLISPSRQLHGCKSLAPCQVSVCIQYCSMALCSLHIIDDEVRGEYHDWSTYSGSGKITKATSSNGLSRGMEANLKGSLIRLSAEPRHQNRSGFVARTLRKRPLLGLYPLTLASIAGRKPQTRPMSISPSCQKGSKVWLVSALRHRLCSGKETPDHPEC
ncbi:unnamed protein product [Fusarium fujikuroi]|nr:unnamed protein product [Fusarium fujikuroi]VZI04301.1 unnamed protein product [Fusarium fujikuroi]